MENLAVLGTFLGGLGVFFIGCALFWFGSLYEKTIKAKQKEEK